MHICMYVYTNIYICTFIPTYTPAYINYIYICTFIPTYTPAYINTYIYDVYFFVDLLLCVCAYKCTYT